MYIKCALYAKRTPVRESSWKSRMLWNLLSQLSVCKRRCVRNMTVQVVWHHTICSCQFWGLVSREREKGTTPSVLFQFQPDGCYGKRLSGPFHSHTIACYHHQRNTSISYPNASIPQSKRLSLFRTQDADIHSPKGFPYQWPVTTLKIHQKPLLMAKNSRFGIHRSAITSKMFYMKLCPKHQHILTN